ncbi:toll/interleukin-1 receptor domain-containing protein [Bosea vaviloviae]|uniref:TIR domain-containing protein n=1 Tax=Bosea vaviloviae TaxID=1526658 RepID=A0A1D7U6M1_9HYPH|nr:toll/interleukin-1 receptor domain-containing protein [Bosea vaviloviae]AOO82984.1 hypothetical protein BHK69_23325 [Bosea vaviloviae]
MERFDARHGGDLKAQGLDMTDFFISYTGVDREWAEWIAYILEEAGFSTVVQAWDFRPGSNFVLAMQKASETAERTVMVLSPDYLKSEMAAPEWASAFARDPQGLERKLLPIMVRACEPQGLLKAIVQVRIVGMDEDASRQAILSGVNRTRAKPSQRPSFPGAASASEHKHFPGPEIAPTRAPRPLLPRLGVAPTDADRRRFAKRAFASIRATFERNLNQVVEEGNGRLDFDVTDATATDFRAELYLDGGTKGQCRVWLGGMMGENNICFAEGRTSGDACNEILAPSLSGELSLSATMSMGHTDFERRTDMKKLTPEQAADYLWERFTRAFRSK